MITKDLFRVKLALIVIDIIGLGVSLLESLDIELKTPVSGVVRDHSDESISIRIVVGV